MRLLVIYQHAPTPGAPGIYRHRMLLGELARRGWQVDVVASPINYMDGRVPEAYAGRRYVAEEIDGVQHHWVRATGDVHRSMRHRAANYATFAAHATAQAIRLPRPDVVWASSPPLSIATTGKWIAKRHRAPWIYEARDLWPESAAAAGLLDPASRAYRALDRMARSYARGADAAIVPTPGLVEPLRAHGAEQVTLITGAIEDAPPDPATRARVREEHGIGADDCLFAYAGAHGIVNGLDVLLDAAERLGTEGTDGRVRIITAGAGSAHEQLLERLRERPIERLQMLGPLPKADARNLLAAADVGLHLLRPDPVFESALPTKVLEYLGCHLPFITTVRGLPAEVAAATGGDLAPDAEALASSMRRWAQLTPSARRELGERAFAWGLEHHGLAASADRLEQLLRDVITTHKAQR